MVCSCHNVDYCLGGFDLCCFDGVAGSLTSAVDAMTDHLLLPFVHIIIKI